MNQTTKWNVLLRARRAQITDWPKQLDLKRLQLGTTPCTT